MVESAEVVLKEGEKLGDPTFLLARVTALSKELTQSLKELVQALSIPDHETRHVRAKRHRVGTRWRYIITADIVGTTHLTLRRMKRKGRIMNDGD